jgi:hypothetical protein
MAFTKKLVVSLTLLLALGVAACGGGTGSSIAPDQTLTPESSGMPAPGATDLGASPAGY